MPQGLILIFVLSSACWEKNEKKKKSNKKEKRHGWELYPQGWS
jgi:hypothetical protein